MGGAWCLPALHPDVAFTLDLGGTLYDQTLAVFALEAHALGVSLPGGKFTTTTNTIAAQWKKYIEAVVGRKSPLALDLAFAVTDKGIAAHVGATRYLNSLRLKPTIEALNEALAGLGWWAYDIVAQSCADRFPIYQIRDYAYFLEENFPCDKFSDQGIVDTFNEMNGEDLTEDEVREQFQGVWPSDLIKDVDGHRWMLSPGDYDYATQRYTKAKRPRAASLRKAKAFAKGNGPAELRAVVKDFIALHQELKRPKSLMSEGVPDTFDDEEALDAVGASCMLVWDHDSLAMELLQHHEEFVMGCGQSTDVHITFNAKGVEANHLAHLAQTIKDFVTRYAAISKAFSHFEVIKC
jgi:PRTRC genetic system protein F